MTFLDYKYEPDPDPDEDPVHPGVVDDLQDLLGSVRKRRPTDPDSEVSEDEDGHLPPDHPDADIYDDLDL